MVESGNGKQTSEFSVVHAIDSPPWITASPSILKLSKDTFMVVLQILQQTAEAQPESRALVLISEDGKKWSHRAAIKNIYGPQVFTCKSGTYIIASSAHMWMGAI